ncbi:MAG: ABC transporter permease [Gammaproteobacteria bacterium]|nr:ABC transporter permease [Gammaproteobacteria bacterium]
MYQIAIKMLVGDKLKYLGLIIGIAFAAMLISQQASIFVGLTRQTGAFIRDSSQADLWLMDPQVRFSQDSIPIRDTMVSLARGTDGVAWAVPSLQLFTRAKMPDGTRFTVTMVGIDDASLTGAPPKMLQGRLEDLRRDRAAIIDGQTASTKLMMLRGGGRPMQVGDRFSINDHEVEVVGSYEGRRSFFWQPVIYTTYSRALAMSPPERHLMSFVFIKLKPDADLETVRRSLQERTKLKAITTDEFVNATAEYILNETGILVNFGLAVLLGVIIGALVAGQTFYNFTLDNLRHYGALKAMGVSDARLTRMVILQAALVGVLGYGIGIGLGAGLGLLIVKAGLAFTMVWQIPLITLAAVMLVSVAAVWLSLRRVFTVEPAIVFKT